jgi:transposase
MVKLVRAGRIPRELPDLPVLWTQTGEFELSYETIRSWVRKANRDDGLDRSGMTTKEREELRRLRRENRQLKLEREILAEAAAWFARKTDSASPRSTNS